MITGGIYRVGEVEAEGLPGEDTPEIAVMRDK